MLILNSFPCCRTPQTKAAHKVYTTYNDKFEKLRPFADVAVSTMNANKDPSHTHTGYDRPVHSSTDNLLHTDEMRGQTYTEPDVDQPSVRPEAHAEPSGSKRFSRVSGVKFGNFGFGKQARRAGELKDLVITRPMETLPSKSIGLMPISPSLIFYQGLRRMPPTNSD